MGSIGERTKELFELASHQQGLFTAKQAEQAGYVSNNHVYHVKAGHWLREARGIYRLALFPKSPDEQKVTYSLWSQNRAGQVLGVYSHETALAHYELSDINPSKLYMTVPKKFRRNSKIPKILKLQYADLTQDMILESRGFFVTKPARTISDIINCGWISFDLVRQAIHEALAKGLLHRSEMKKIITTTLAPADNQKQFALVLKEIDE
jgi:predicted transcriptional regulator of viral defense system